MHGTLHSQRNREHGGSTPLSIEVQQRAGVQSAVSIRMLWKWQRSSVAEQERVWLSKNAGWGWGLEK